ncbi:universal stress protein UspA [Niveispirillum lacus]|uniref:Universal stress protein UspA n=1 Tax=Niveispirillum lacus TaxID=1981099 RepID=A0A255Z1T4_9PROT|nr:universal stress protein [Niveispirillum lacus]OYQ34610.1 universal stress protein UspA [Niveispirillum lacus]
MTNGRTAYLPLATYPDVVPDDALRAAVALAETLQYDLHVTAFTADIPGVSSPVGGLFLNIPEMIRTTEAYSQAEAKRQQELISALVPATVSLECATRHLAPGAIADTAAGEARYYDLSLLGWTKDHLSIHDLAQTVIFGAGRPAILVPPVSRPAALDHVAIAWDGGRAAARALADALPLLKPGTRITVLTVPDEKKLHHHDIAETLAVSLRRHGFLSEARNIKLNGRPIAEVLQDAALDLSADLLVMGGFGHSRLRDFVLGGATTGVFANLRLPVLLSH